MFTLKDGWTREQIEVLDGLDTPARIQAFVDGLPYNPEENVKSPRAVLEVGNMHCVEGAFFAFACLTHHGYNAGVMDFRAVNDEEHILAVYRLHGRWGSIGKSKFLNLGGREPVYHSEQELAMSYFHSYFNASGERTFRGYLVDDMSRFGDGWFTSGDDLNWMSEELGGLDHAILIPEDLVLRLTPVGRRAIDAALGDTPREWVV
ncbi:MAG: hypothetical protein L0Z54_03800 [Thermoplasmata archaeon]|nr:hypothetical protein [Thermoplasmata archaeon]